MALIECSDSDYSIGVSKEDNGICINIDTEWNTWAASIYFNSQIAKNLLNTLQNLPRDILDLKEFKTDYNMLKLQKFDTRLYIQIDKGLCGTTAFVTLNSEGVEQLIEELKKAIDAGN